MYYLIMYLVQYTCALRVWYVYFSASTMWSLL